MPHSGETANSRDVSAGVTGTHQGSDDVYDPLASFRNERLQRQSGLIPFRRDRQFGLPNDGTNDSEVIRTAFGNVPIKRYVHNLIKEANELSQGDTKQLGQLDQAKLQVAETLKPLNSEDPRVRLQMHDLCELYEEKLGGDSARYATDGVELKVRLKAIEQKCAEISGTQAGFKHGGIAGPSPTVLMGREAGNKTADVPEGFNQHEELLPSDSQAKATGVPRESTIQVGLGKVHISDPTAQEYYDELNKLHELKPLEQEKLAGLLNRTKGFERFRIYDQFGNFLCRFPYMDPERINHAPVGMEYPTILQKLEFLGSTGLLEE
jgi:hypothetical protein